MNTLEACLDCCAPLQTSDTWEVCHLATPIILGPDIWECFYLMGMAHGKLIVVSILSGFRNSFFKLLLETSHQTPAAADAVLSGCSRHSVHAHTASLPSILHLCLELMSLHVFSPLSTGPPSRDRQPRLHLPSLLPLSTQ